MKGFIGFLLMSILSICAAFADKPGTTLMVNMNLSFTEEAHARAAATARGELFDTIPNLTEAQKSVIIPIRTKYEAYENAFHCWADHPQNTPVQCSAPPGTTSKNIYDLMTPMKKDILNKIGEWDPRFKTIPAASSSAKTFGAGKAGSSSDAAVAFALQSELKKIAASGSPINGLILSGHSGNSGFTGLAGELSKADLIEINKDPSTQAAMSQVKDFLAWGCYSTVIQSTNDYLALFPNARLVAGFDGRGPKEDKQGDWQYLESMLSKAKELGEKVSPNSTTPNQEAEKQAIAKTVGSFQKTLDEMNSAFLVCKSAQAKDRYYYHKRANEKVGSVDSLDDLMKACMKQDGSDSAEVTQLLNDYGRIIMKYGTCLKDSQVKPSADILAAGLPPIGPSHNAMRIAMNEGANAVDPKCKVPDSGTGEIKLLYDTMSRLSYCPNKALIPFFGNTEHVQKTLNSILFLRMFGVFLDNWMRVNGSLISDYNQKNPGKKINISSHSTRGEVVKAFIQFSSAGAGDEEFQEKNNKLISALEGLVNLDSRDYNTNWAIPGGVR